MDDRHLGAPLGQKEGLLEGRVTAAHHRHRTPLVKGPVTHRAVRQASSHQVGLPGQSQLPVAHPSGQHQGQTLLRSSVRCQLNNLSSGAHGGHALHPQLRPLLPDLPGQLVGKVAAPHAGQSRIVLHQGGIGDLTAQSLLLQDQDRLARPGSIQGGSQTGGPAAHNDNIIHIKAPLPVRSWKEKQPRNPGLFL